MVNINIAIGKKEAIFFTAIAVLIIGIIGVNAYGSGGPAATFGHDAGELEGVIGESVLIAVPVTVYDDTASISSFYDVTTMPSSPSPPSDVKEVLVKTYLKADPTFGSSAMFEYWLTISPPINPRTVSHISNIDGGTETKEESTLTWLPLNPSGRFQYRCTVSGPTSRCRVKIFGFRA